ncbi:MAG: adenosine deaminase family protein [Acidobacteriaceae bacterium]
MFPRARFAIACNVFAFLLGNAAFPQTKAQPDAREHRTAQALLAAEKSGPLDLYAFLEKMPKGGDLHNHLTGAIYAETWIAEAAADRLCVNATTLVLSKPTSLTPTTPPQPVCSAGEVAAASSLENPELYSRMVDAYSMRAFVPTEGDSGHDHFFNSFGKFDVVSKPHAGESLDAVAKQAASENTQYLELMTTPDFGHGRALGAQLGWNSDLEQFRRQLLAHGLQAGVLQARNALENAEAKRRAIEHCGQPDAAPACTVQTRFLFQVLRGFPPQQVFAQMVLGFEIASAVPDVVGVNIVMAEDGPIAMRDYHLHMQMFDLLHRDYPKVHLSLHAGELAPGLVPPSDLRFHIREAVELGHAQRIGHGVDVMYEDHPYELLRELARRHVLVEINLTSNAEILGVSGSQHPFPIYRRFGVPLALSTDDEGVSRITLTHEYVRAVEEFHLNYSDLKQMVRASLEHSFLPGASLWPLAENSTPERFAQMAPACAHDEPAFLQPSAGCAAYLAASPKAQQQWELESRLHAFEARY